MSGRYLLGIDQSTSGTKALLFSDRGAILHRCDVAHAQHYPRPGWVEHDPEEIYRNTILAVRKLLAETGVDRAGIAALALTNQRETAVVWEKGSGRPVHNAVVWQCQRGAAICDSLAARLEGEGRADLIKERTGLVLSPYFSASKIRWILDNVPGAREKAERGGLLCGLMLLEIMAHHGKRLGELVEDLHREIGPHCFERVDLHLDAPEMEKARRLSGEGIDALGGIPVHGINRTDGIKFSLADGSWLLIRPSGTEPVLRIYAEASEPDLTRNLLSAGRQIVNHC